MVKERFEILTRAKVLQLGVLVLVLGALGFGLFRLIGLDQASAGIAAEAILVLGVFVWTGSYIFRVVTGNMTFMEQRKRYRKAYEDQAISKLQSEFNSMSEEDQIKLMKELDIDKTES